MEFSWNIHNFLYPKLIKKIKIYPENSKFNCLKFLFYFIKNCIPKLDLSLLKDAFKDILFYFLIKSIYIFI